MSDMVGKPSACPQFPKQIDFEISAFTLPRSTSPLSVARSLLVTITPLLTTATD